MIVDLAIVAFTGFFVWRGMRRGILVSLVGLAGFVAAVALAVLAYRPAAGVVRAVSGASHTVSYIAGALIVFVGVSAGAFVAARALRRLVRRTKWGMIDRAGGGALAAVWALSWVTAVLLALQTVPAPRAVSTQVRSSALARAIVREGPHLATRAAWDGLVHLFDAFAAHR